MKKLKRKHIWVKKIKLGKSLLKRLRKITKRKKRLSLLTIFKIRRKLKLRALVRRKEVKK